MSPSTWSCSPARTTSSRRPRCSRPVPPRWASRSTSSCSTGRSTPSARDRIGTDHGLAPEAGPAGRGRVDALAAAGQAQLGRDAAPGQGARRRRHRGLLAVDGPAPSRPGRPRPARRWGGGRDRRSTSTPARASSSSSSRPRRSHPCQCRDQPDGRRTRAVVPDAHRQDGPGDEGPRRRAPPSSSWRPTRVPSRTSRPGAGRPATILVDQTSDGAVYRFVIRRK